jgi:hypothetical protein
MLQRLLASPSGNNAGRGLPLLKILECDFEIIFEQSDIKIVPHADCPRDKTSGHTNDDTFFILEHATLVRPSHGACHFRRRPAIGACKSRDILQVVDIAIDGDLLTAASKSIILLIERQAGV